MSNSRLVGISRRKTIGGLIGTAGLIASCDAFGGEAQSYKASATNPRLLYAFNPRDLERATLCDGLSFSRSGKYLAIVNSSATYSRPAFSVWDVEARQCLFKTSDGEVISGVSYKSKPIWGKDDEWVAVGQPISNGTLLCLDPKTGKNIRRIKGVTGDIKLNLSGTKLLIKNFGPGLNTPKVSILDIESNESRQISLVNCSNKFQLICLAHEWMRDDDIFLLGYGSISENNKCDSADIQRSLDDKQKSAQHYFVSVINSNDLSTKRILNCDGWPPTHGESSINYATNKICLAGRCIVDANTLEITPIAYYQDTTPPGATDFNPDGKLIYIPETSIDVQVPSGSNGRKGGIFDTTTGDRVSQFPSATYQTQISLSPDGRYLALARDLNVEIYQIS